MSKRISKRTQVSSKVIPWTVSDILDLNSRLSKLPRIPTQLPPSYHDPLSLVSITNGYMLKAFFNADVVNEVRFMIDVDRLRDISEESVTRHSTKNWQEIDLDVQNLETFDNRSNKYFNVLVKNVNELLISTTRVEPTTINRQPYVLANQMEKICFLYFDQNALYKVHLRRDLFDRLKLRIKYKSLYNHEVFGEVLDVVMSKMSNLQKIFLTTPEYLQMMIFLANNVLPIRGSMATLSPIKKLTELSPNENFKIDSKCFIQIHYNANFYEHFLSYSTLRGCEGCVLGCRLLHMFQDPNNRFDKIFLEETAWKVYRYFIAVGSCYKLSISSLVAKEIMRNLAMPKLTMFADIKKNMVADCEAIFEDFIMTRKGKYWNDCCGGVEENFLRGTSAPCVTTSATPCVMNTSPRLADQDNQQPQCFHFRFVLPSWNSIQKRILRFRNNVS